MTARNRTDPPPLHDLAIPQLTAESFEPVYHTLMELRFPVDVAQVLELRYLVNHAVDEFAEPPATKDYREFREALQAVIQGFGIENKRHIDRLLRILAMMRELHYEYSVKTRDQETQLREQLATQRRAREQSIRYGLFFTVAATVSGVIWFGLNEVGWPIKLLTIGFAVLGWTYLQAMPNIDRRRKTVERKLEDLLRHRVKSIHWRMLIQKLSLVLGYKRISGMEVFRVDTDMDFPGQSHWRH